MLFTDIVGSTELKSTLGDVGYKRLLDRHNEIFRAGITRTANARTIKHTGDGFLAEFRTPSDAVRFALWFQQSMCDEPWGAKPLTTRVGIHQGEVTATVQLDRDDVVGAAVDAAGRIMSLALGGQILLTQQVFNDARQYVRDAHANVRWLSHGPYWFKGIDEPVTVCEVGIEGVNPLAPPASNEQVKRVVPHDQEQTLGWRPAIGLDIPGRLGWVLERKLGDGGFGEVWLGVHSKLKERRVFKFCFDADRLRSFKREITLFRLLREALGERPDIARLFEVKLDEPPFYLESEYTEGGNLLEWSERQGGIAATPLDQRLELVAKVADAVAAAHSVGVLHKDIKPSNILIHESSTDGVLPRLADFGIGILSDRSQLRGHSITETGFTQLTLDNDSSRTGTRMYAPPESLLNKPFTTQGDVYALGVLLFQMVVGDLTRPLAPGWERDISDDLLRQDIAAMVEGDPARRLSSAAEVATRLRTLQDRRQELSRQAAADRAVIRRRRVRRALVGATALLLLLAVGLTIAYQRERTQRYNAEYDRQEMLNSRNVAQEARRREATLRAQAEEEVKKTTEINSFLQEILASSDPQRGRGRDLTVRQAVDEAAKSLHLKFTDHPDVAAALNLTIGKTYLSLQFPDTAIEYLKKSIALTLSQPVVDQMQLTDAMLTLAFAHAARAGQGDQQAAQSLMNQVVAIREKMFPEGSRELEDAKGYRNQFTVGMHSLRSYADLLAAMAAERGLSTQQIILELHATVSEAAKHAKAGDLAAARAAVRKTAEQYLQVPGIPVDDVTDIIYNVAESPYLLVTGNTLAIEPLLMEALAIDRERNGNPTIHSSYYLRSLGDYAMRVRRFELAEDCYRHAMELVAKLVHPDSPQVKELSLLCQGAAKARLKSQSGTPATRRSG